MNCLQHKKIIILFCALGGVLFFLPFCAYAITSTNSNSTSVSASVPSSGISGGSSEPLQPLATPSPQKDMVAPAAITNLSASNATSNSVTLQWTSPGDDGNTGTAASYSVRYGLSAISSESAWGSATNVAGVGVPAIAGTTQSVYITGLNPQITYYFAIRATDEAGNQGGLSNSPSAATIQSAVPVISNVQVVVSAHTALISWVTDTAADSQITYGVTTDLGAIVSKSLLTHNHSITLSGLIANKKYYFLIHSADASGNTGSGEVTSFVTTADATPPANASQASIVIGNEKLTLQWKNPSDSDFAGVLIQRALFAAPQSLRDGQTVYNGNGSSLTDTGLQNDTTYYYTIFAYDSSENYASGVTVSAAPLASSNVLSSPPSATAEGSAQETPSGGAGAQTTQGSAVVGIGSSGGGGGGSFAAPQTIISNETLARISLSSITFLTAGESVVLFPDEKNKIHALAGQNFSLAINESVLKDMVFQQIVFQFNGDTYIMKKNERTATWRVTIQMQDVRQQALGIVKLLQANSTTNLLSIDMVVEPRGLIYTESELGNKPIKGAEATLFTLNSSGVWEKWIGGVYNQKNPQTVGEDGGYGWVVPQGAYFYSIEKEGFRAFESNKIIVKSGNIFNNSVRLIEIPPSLAEVIKIGAPLQENVKNVAKNLGKQTNYVRKIINQEVQQFTQNPEVQKTTERIVAPTVAGAAVVNVSTAVGFGQLVPYLRFLFTQPLLVFSRRRRKGWGVVYNSLTKTPLALATVRLIDAVNGRIAQSRVTDAEGRYAFFVKPGTYKIQINQKSFIFPSQFLAGLREDNQFIDLYHGEPISVASGGALVTANVPLDPAEAEKPVGMILRQLFWRRFQHSMSIVSLILAGGFLIIKPSLITVGVTAVQIGFYFVFRRLAIPRKPKSWGIIYDKSQKLPLARTIARIFDKKFNKLLETQVTDKDGKYAFLVGKNEYYVIFEHAGYEKQTSDTINLTKIPEPVSVVGFDVEMQKQNSK
ncbi:MAG: fibronectin type III domain-containing protein [Candidatus Magasanikbacteria bacterium]|nr:fibronectin type III domain-containing protein [Candidatus Magasanikbacteria bacterium]